MKRFQRLEYPTVYTVGALGYGGIELLWRGATHWTMPLLGGLCFVLIYAVTAATHGRPWLTWPLCAAGVTAMEFAAGCLVNLYLGWAVWDYGGLPGNVLGQICPLYALYWLLLSIPCSLLSRGIRRGFRGGGARSL